MAASVLSPPACRAADAPIPPEIENPQLSGINKEPAHATLMPYASLEEALKLNRHASSFCRSMNGPWKFHWVERPEQRPVDFYKPDFDVSGWDDIPVPSNWQVLGYGTPYYRNHGYIIQKDWPRVMSEPPKNYTTYKERNPVGSYRRDFEVPADWDGRRIFLTFDGVDSAFFLWINGEKVGFSVNSRNAAEFDITRYLKPGKNSVAAEVYRFSSGTYLEDQDMWRLSGIFRNVTLWSSPEVHIRDFFAKPDLDSQYRDGQLDVTAKIRNYGDKAASARKLNVEIHDPAAKTVVAKVAVDVPALAAGEEKAVAVKIPVENPRKWTAETPELYTTVLTLGEGSAATEILSCQTGFRKVELKGRIFTINGVPVKLKGANRHEHWPDTGHYVTEERMIRDLEVLKQANCNHVRTSHYTNDPRWYELCDQWGIYLTGEANIESHGYRFGPESLSHPKEWEAAHIDRNVANVESVKNHSSVIMWSLGNEAGPGANFVAANKAVKAIDSSRPTHYEGFGIGAKNPADVDSNMYPTVGDVERIAKDSKTYTKPYYLCEFAHAMFNSMGSLDEYSEMFDKHPEVMGGAIWEWQDQGLWNKRDPNRPFLAYGGGFGEFPNDRYFIHKGVVFSDRSPKPHFPQAKRAFQWIGMGAEDLAAGKIKVRNKYQFIGLDGFEASWTVTEDGQVADQGKLAPLNLAPGKEAVVSIPMKPVTPKPGASYFLNVSFKLTRDKPWAKAGYEVAAWQCELPFKAPAKPLDPAGAKPVELDNGESRITVTGEGFSVVFDKTRGVISQMTRNGFDLLVENGGPKPQLWRAPHQRDDIWAYKHWKNYGITGLEWTPVSVAAEATANGAVRIAATLQADGNEGFRVMHSAVYTIYGDGTIAVDNAITPLSGARIPLARMGVRMLLNKQLDQFTFLGRGPLENYGDRKTGSDVGLYSSSVRDQMTPYAKPMECGNHEDVRWALLKGAETPGLLAQGDDSLIQATAIPYTDEQMDPVEYSIDLPESTATVFTLASRTLGVGSNGCGPRPLEPYIVWSDPAAFSYLLRLIPAANGSQPVVVAAPQARVKPLLGQRDDQDRVKLTSDTPEATIEYSLDGKTWMAYHAPFELKTAGSVAVRASKDGMQPYQGHVLIRATGVRSRWKISASSFERVEGVPANALDGSVSTHWLAGKQKHPHHLVIEFNQPTKVAQVIYRGRMGDAVDGRVKDYEIYLSEDGKNWGRPVVKGVLQDHADQQAIVLPEAVTARFMKFVALSEARGKDSAAVSELDVVTAD